MTSSLDSGTYYIDSKIHVDLRIKERPCFGLQYPYLCPNSKLRLRIKYILIHVRVGGDGLYYRNVHVDTCMISRSVGVAITSRSRYRDRRHLAARARNRVCLSPGRAAVVEACTSRRCEAKTRRRSNRPSAGGTTLSRACYASSWTSTHVAAVLLLLRTS